MRRASLLLLLACVPVVTTGACQRARVVVVPKEPELDYRRMRKKDPQSGTIIHSWSMAVYPDGHAVKHGKDERWFANGARLSEANYYYGEPVGDFRRWDELGQMRAESSYDVSGKLTPMRFWHANGQLSAEGPGRQGTREGYWTFWYDSGLKREEGGFVDGERSGVWTLYHDDGSVQATGRYEDGDRVGPWRRFERGERPAEDDG